jgi:small subunit ribosomal protein S4
MARYTGPVCRLCRRERTKLFLKGERCYSLKCPVSEAVTDRHSRAYPPGEHGRDRMRQGSEYLAQLREKQKARRIYFTLEGQFREYYEKASRTPGVTGELLLQQLERRLDNVTFRLGFASSRRQARQLVRHGHVEVNGRKVNIPSYQVGVGDDIKIRPNSTKLTVVESSREIASHNPLPGWLSSEPNTLSGKVLALPKRDDINLPVNEQLIVELYSK